MSRITVTLPEPLGAFVDRQIAEGGYADAEDFVRALVRRERDRLHLRALLLEGPASGPGDHLDDRSFVALREAIRKGAP